MEIAIMAINKPNQTYKLFTRERETFKTKYPV